VRVGGEDSRVQVEVVDEGKGFDPGVLGTAALENVSLCGIVAFAAVPALHWESAVPSRLWNRLDRPRNDLVRIDGLRRTLEGNRAEVPEARRGARLRPPGTIAPGTAETP